MITKILFVVFLICLTSFSCSKAKDCFVADSVNQIKIVNINENEYYLYHRISGFNEKEHFYELYIREPEFDVCGKSNVIPVSDVHIDTTKGYLEKLIIKDKMIQVIYSKNMKNEINYSSISVEVKQR